MTFKPAGGDKLDAWLESEPDLVVRRRVVEWLMGLMQDPGAVVPEVTPVPGQRLPIVTVFVPGTDVAVTFYIARPFHVVVLLRVETVRL